MSNEQKSTPKQKPAPKLERIGARKLEKRIGPPRLKPKPIPRKK